MPNAKGLRAVLGSQTTDKSVHAQAILQVIQGATSPDERIELLAIALVERDSVPKAPAGLPNKGIPQDLWDQLVRSHSEMIDGHLKMAFFKSTDANLFASEILRLIEFFPDENEKTFALAKSLFSPYVPYLGLPGIPVHMTEAQYRHQLESDKRRVDLIDYIMALPFDERTERASMLLQVIDDTTDKNLRVALLAHANYRNEKRTERRILDSLREG